MGGLAQKTFEFFSDCFHGFLGIGHVRGLPGPEPSFLISVDALEQNGVTQVTAPGKIIASH